MTRKAELSKTLYALEHKLRFYSVDPDTFGRRIADIEQEIREIEAERSPENLGEMLFK